MRTVVFNIRNTPDQQLYLFLDNNNQFVIRNVWLDRESKPNVRSIELSAGDLLCLAKFIDSPAFQEIIPLEAE